MSALRGAVLCAGLGTRLRPVTDVIPKPAISFLGRPLVTYALATLKQAGVASVGFNTHHLPEVMARCFEAQCAAAGFPAPFRSHEEVIQGTGGGIRGLRPALEGGVSVVLNGDVLFGVELAPIVAAHRASGAIASMVLLPMPEGEKFNPVEVNAEGEVRRIAGVGPGGDRLVPWHFSGVHLLSPELFEFMQPGVEDINRDVYPRAIAAGKVVRAQVLKDRGVFWSDVGSPARYLDALAEALWGRVSFAPFGSASPFEGMQKHGLSWVHPAASMGDARFSGPAWFGPGAALGAGVRIGATVAIGANATVGAGAHLNRVAVLDGARVPDGVLLEDCLVAPGGVLAKR
jgi:mannose-1-phosphate guanylyltransferase